MGPWPKPRPAQLCQEPQEHHSGEQRAVLAALRGSGCWSQMLHLGLQAVPTRSQCSCKPRTKAQQRGIFCNCAKALLPLPTTDSNSPSHPQRPHVDVQGGRARRGSRSCCWRTASMAHDAPPGSLAPGAIREEHPTGASMEKLAATVQTAHAHTILIREWAAALGRMPAT